MKIDSAGLQIIKDFEGLSLKPYLDVRGVPTIGYGTTHYDYRAVTIHDRPISLEVATSLLRTQVDDIYGKAVNHYVRVPISQSQFDALTSFTYNEGTHAFKTSHLLKYINENNFDQAQREFHKWNKSGGRVVKGLANRRERERRLFIIGIHHG